ncbi:hypothetical protein RJ639_005649 [Escallonia herrerae]|uniref:Integrase catalytic domain-containing protein n=1 Tax=Escallonia herrerae TaxID=1293975 RepID=A0AA89AZ57_9ASTE|nr:hypothetical protein RJ639_005649 [Escallonia herrerae]
MTKSLTNCLYLKQRLYTLRIKEGTSISDHLDEYNKVILDLDIKVEDKDKALLLLCSLPPSYKHLVTTLLYRKDSISMEEVEAVINSQELRKKVSENRGEEHGDGLMAQGRSTDHAGSKNKGRSRSQSKTRKLKCYHCHKERKWKKKDNSKTADAGVVEDNSNSADVLSVTISSLDGGWILEMSCSYHMCPNRDWFVTYRSFHGGKVLMGENVACKVVRIGSIQIRLHDGSTVTGAAAAASSSDIDSDTTKLWHMHLGHMSERGMDVLSKQGLLGSKKTRKLDFYEHCVFGKQCKIKFSRVVHTTKGTVDYIHSDLWGPSTVPSKGGGRYMLTFIDDFSRKVSMYILKKKSDVFVQWKQFKIMIEKQTEKEIKRLRTDNGMEFYLDKFTKFCKNEDIVRYCTVRKMPQHNGITERMNRTLLERARYMLSNARLSKEFWAEAINTAAYLVNRSPSTVIDCKTPEEVWSGYANGVKGYQLWCPDSKSSKFLISRDVTFDESLMLSKKEFIDARKYHGVREKVELEVQAPDSLPIIPTDEDDGSHSIEKNEEPQEQ